MTSMDLSSRAFTLPMPCLPTPTLTLPSIPTGTSDNLPDYFGESTLETTTFPSADWVIHLDIITQLRAEKLWEDVKGLIAAGVKLSAAGREFAMEWNKVVEECIDEYSSKNKVAEMQMKKLGVVAGWSEKMTRLRRKVESASWEFEERSGTENGRFELGVKTSFAMHSNLGRQGDGKKWWVETVEELRRMSELWLAAPVTMEMWLKMFSQVLVESEIEEVRVYADALCASYERAEGMKSRRELVYVIRNGEVQRKGEMAWVSVELGHITGD